MREWGSGRFALSGSALTSGGGARPRARRGVRETAGGGSSPRAPRPSPWRPGGWEGEGTGGWAGLDAPCRVASLRPSLRGATQGPQESGRGASPLRALRPLPRVEHFSARSAVVRGRRRRGAPPGTERRRPLTGRARGRVCGPCAKPPFWRVRRLNLGSDPDEPFTPTPARLPFLKTQRNLQLSLLNFLPYLP